MPYSNFSPEPFTGARVIPMIGRQQPIQQIIRLAETTNQSCLIYVTGIGGIGKTRLITHVLETVKKEPAYHVANSLIDLYHADNATVEGMVDQAVLVLDREESAFVGYYDLRRQLSFARATRPDDTQGINKLREDMLARFIIDANTISQQKRLVFALDTAEKLDLQHSYVAERLDINEGRSETVARLCAAIKGLTNTVVILAGRPNSRYLLDEFSGRLGSQFHHLDLQGLNRMETEAYFKEVIAQLQNSEKNNDRRVAQWLVDAEAPPQSIFQALHDDPTTGEEATVRPIMLALAIDLVITVQESATLDFLRSTAPLTSEERKANRDRLGAEIVGANREDPSDDEELIRILGWMRKGGTPELLYQLLALKYQPSQADFDATLTNIKRLSFIKQRPSDQRLFLHDEMYDLVQTHALKFADPDRERVYRHLLAHYAREVQLARTTLSELTQKQVATDEEQEQLLDAIITKQNELRTLQVEEVHYRLRAHADRGFQYYYRVSGEAVIAHDHQLGALLRTEMGAFVKEVDLQGKPSGVEGLFYTDVVADEAVRWIQWRHDKGEYDAAFNIAESLQGKLNQEIVKPGGVIAQAELDSWHGLIHAERGNYSEAERRLAAAIKRLEKAIAMLPQKTPRVTGVLAYAYHNQGYLFSNQGRHHRAIEAYNRTLPLWRALQMDGQRANTLNNLSFEQAEIGDFDSARRLNRDALTVRQQLSQRLPLGLSFNTLAEINIRAFSSEIAMQEALQAKTIFEELGHRRGYGMALRALAEATRRVSGSPATRGQKRTLELLEQSEKYAEEAVAVFEFEVKEPVRQVWALIELGCIYREWLRYRMTNQKELSPREAADERSRLTVEELYKRSAKAFEKAATSAKEINQVNHRLDALINWAWLLYYRSFNHDTGNFADNAQQIKDSLFTQIEQFFGQHYGKRTPQFMHGLTNATEERITRDDYLIRLGDWESFQGEATMSRFQATNAPADLQAAVEHFAIALACYAHYGDNDVRQTRRSRNRLYDLLKSCDSAILFQIYTNVEGIEEKFGWASHASKIWEFLIDNFGPQEEQLDLQLGDDFYL